jgi:glycosyltransferase involved in cell wall biosynthesis
VADSAISVVMPTFNRSRFIVDALDSVARQTRPPLEVLVVDDRSTDDTRRRVEAHPLASRVRYWLQPENRGASVARNRGVEMARSDVIVFLDSDDVLEPDHHEVVLEVLQRAPDVALVGCDCVMVGPGGERLHADTWTAIQCRIKGYTIASGRRSLADLFLFSTPFPGMTVRRADYLAVGGLEQAIFPLDDYDLQLKIAAAGRAVHYEHRALARYRDHGGNESGPGKSVRVGRQKLACLLQAWNRFPALGVLGERARRRIGEVRRELALSLLREGRTGEGSLQLGRSLWEDPTGIADVSRILRRKLTGSVAAATSRRLP